MDHYLPHESTADRIRSIRVSRRLAAARFGRSTRNYQRMQQLHQVAFIVLLALGVVGGVLLMVA